MPTKSVSNEDILELLQESMQMTSENFDRLEARLDKHDDRMDAIQADISETKHEVRDLKKSSYRQELAIGKLQGQLVQTANEITAVHADINEILHRLGALEAEIQLASVDPKNLQATLQDMLDKIKTIAKNRGVKLEF